MTNQSEFYELTFIEFTVAEGNCKSDEDRIFYTTSTKKKRIFNKSQIRRNYNRPFTNLEDMKECGFGKHISFEPGEGSNAKHGWDKEDFVCFMALENDLPELFHRSEAQIYDKIYDYDMESVFISSPNPILLDIKKV